MASAPLVLCYHAVSDRWADPLAVPARVLVTQVRRLLGRGLRPVDAAEILDRPAGSFHVTFDDAYRNIEQVLPELRSLGAGVTVFACSDLASDGAPLASSRAIMRSQVFDTSANSCGERRTAGTPASSKGDSQWPSRSVRRIR